MTITLRVPLNDYQVRAILGWSGKEVDRHARRHVGSTLRALLRADIESIVSEYADDRREDVL